MNQRRKYRKGRKIGRQKKLLAITQTNAAARKKISEVAALKLNF
jgi:hypothetical protein